MSPSLRNPLKALHDEGTAVWLDFVARKFIEEGDLAKLVANDGLSGVTSNPSIFEKAIGHSDDYDEALKAAMSEGDRDVMQLYERFAIEDIQHAADALRPVYDATNAQDGYVSLEVSPYRANDTQATISEARRLWAAVNRPNLMIKVPGTEAGVPAIRTLIGEGLNINVTLLFSGDAYEKVADAYIGGLEDLAARGGDVSRIASVASFFVSRIDVSAEHEIDRALTTLASRDDRDRLKSVMGKVAIANAKLAYRRYQRLFSGARWDALSAKGAMVQRLLWASTGRKNKAYSDVLYVEQLIAPDTVNTMPPETMDAFRDHGSPHQSLTQGLDEAESVMATLAAFGISLDQITADLVTDGVKSFADSFDKLLGAVATKRYELLGNRVNSLHASLPGDLEAKVDAALKEWRASGKMRKLWAGDASIWTGKDEGNWLGWLDIVTTQIADKAHLAAMADDIRSEDFAHVVLLGMGGSSLGAEVLGRVFAERDHGPRLIVLDSTDPAEIRTVEGQIDLRRTLFLVSSKSGTTLEPNVLKDYFFARVREAVGENPGRSFIAITDPDTPLVDIAKHTVNPRSAGVIACCRISACYLRQPSISIPTRFCKAPRSWRAAVQVRCRRMRTRASSSAPSSASSAMKVATK
jgi:transaldolase/glucose-6-phosphate isomerase